MFTIGYHEVEGSLTTLKKPVAILKRRFAAPDASVSGADQVLKSPALSERPQLQVGVTAVHDEPPSYIYRPYGSSSHPSSPGNSQGRSVGNPRCVAW